MTPEQQRIAIAEACGWTNVAPRIVKNVKHEGDDITVGIWSDDGWVPQYLNDLNAMHEAEEVIPRQLYHVDYWQKGYGRFQQILSGLTITPYSATASQRAEAFLRTIGKWEEVKP
jgi:hypothetical protein